MTVARGRTGTPGPAARARPGPARTGPARTGPARTGPARTGPGAQAAVRR